MSNINITYLRSRARQLRQAHTETEYQELLEKLACYLNISQVGESLTTERRQKIFSRLRSLGINAYRTAQHK